MTEKLYYEDVEQLTFTARVLSCEARGDHFEAVLDRTAFFPEGGGQPADQGTLGNVRVLDVHEKHGEVVHLTDAELIPGELVTGQVDGIRRRDMMQQHSGEHIFSGLVHRLFGYDNVGFHMGSEAVTMDFNGPISEEDADRIETLANEVIWSDVPVRVYTPSPADVEMLVYRSKKKLEGEVRIVEIPGVDMCACCGTHVQRTGSIGLLKVLGVQKYKKGVRVSILCGRRALLHLKMVSSQMQEMARMLSTRKENVLPGVCSLLKERDQAAYERDSMAMKLFHIQMQQLSGEIRVVCCNELPASQMGKAAVEETPEGQVTLLLSGTASEGWNFALACRGRAREITRELCRSFEGKGGGDQDLTRGKLGICQPEELRNELEKIWSGMNRR